MLIAKQDPESAAEEIRRVGDHSKIRQVITVSGTREPYGKRQYWPIYKAAEEMGLPVAMHPATEGNGTANPPTGAGYPSTYYEWHTLLSANYTGQLVSLVSEGIFEEFPDLNWVFVEDGVTWLPHYLWRMDKNWKGLRSEIPWLERPPSEYVKDHVRFTTQPIAEPDNPADLRRMLEIVDGERTVMFASDYLTGTTTTPNAGSHPLTTRWNGVSSARRPPNSTGSTDAGPAIVAAIPGFPILDAGDVPSAVDRPNLVLVIAVLLDAAYESARTGERIAADLDI